MEDELRNALCDDIILGDDRIYLHYGYIKKLANQLRKLDAVDLTLALMAMEYTSGDWTLKKKEIDKLSKSDINAIYDTSYSLYKKAPIDVPLINPAFLPLLIMKESKKDDKNKKEVK